MNISINKFTDFGRFVNVNLHLCWYDYLDFTLKSVIKRGVSLMSLDISLFRKKNTHFCFAFERFSC